MPSSPESRFTPAHPDCRHPEWWSATDAQSAEVEVAELVGAMVRALQPEYVVETGTYVGRTAEVIGRALARNGHGWLDTLEVAGEPADEAAARCLGLPVTVHTVSSLEFTPAAPIGFAWLDSSMDQRIAELDRFRDWFAPGAVIGVHDTSPHMGLLGRHIEQMNLRSVRLRTPRGVTFVQIDQ